MFAVKSTENPLEKSGNFLRPSWRNPEHGLLLITKIFILAPFKVELPAGLFFVI